MELSFQENTNLIQLITQFDIAELQLRRLIEKMQSSISIKKETHKIVIDIKRCTYKDLVNELSTYFKIKSFPSNMDIHTFVCVTTIPSRILFSPNNNLSISVYKLDDLSHVFYTNYIDMTLNDVCLIKRFE